MLFLFLDKPAGLAFCPDGKDSISGCSGRGLNCNALRVAQGKDGL